MKILIIGGNRYFGKDLVKLLSKIKNYKIYTLNRGSKKNITKNVEHIKCNRKNLKLLKKKLKQKKFDLIFDNAAYHTDDLRKLFAALHNKPKHYFLTSSIMVSYLVNKKFNLLKKNYTRKDIIYAENKLKCERFLKKKKNYTILRVHSVIGKKDFSLKTKYFLSTSQIDLDHFSIKNDDFIQFIIKEDLIKLLAKLISRYSAYKNKIIEIASKPLKIDKIKRVFKNLEINKRFIKTEKYPIPINIISENYQNFPILKKLKNLNIS